VDLLRRLRVNPIVDLVVTLAVAALIAYVVQLWIVKPYQVPSASMEQTLHIGDRIIAARFLYHFTDPKRGDIVVFHPNGVGDNAEPVKHVASVVYVKRLIGLPGEWVQAVRGHVEICKRRASGCRILKEPYARPPQEDFGPTYVPPGHYFMMGDNRGNSADSRVWGTIRRSQIIGRAFMIYWPLTRLRFF
jgi:signal peptidase I